MEDIEIWKPIVGYEGHYEVSNHGRVRLLDRLAPYSLNGGGFKKLKGKMKNLQKCPCRPMRHEGDYYVIVGLCKDKIQKSYPVHLLVARAFISNPKNKREINHIDEVKFNNHVSNLEWSDPREQSSHRTHTKTSKYIGVSWHSYSKKWHAAIHTKGKPLNLGYYINEEEARDAYLNYLKENGIENKYAIFQ